MMNIKTKNILLIIVVAIFALFLLAQALWLFVLPDFVNKKLANSGLKNAVYSKTGLELSYKKAFIKTYPNFNASFFADNVKLDDKKHQQILSFKNFKTSIHTRDILFKKINLENIQAEDFYFIFSRQKNGKFYIGTYELSDNANDFDIKIDKFNAKTKNSKIIFDDKLLDKKITTDIENAVFYYEKGKKAEAQIDSKIYINDKQKTSISIEYSSDLPIKKSLKANSLNINGTLKNLDLSDYSTYFANYSKKDILSVSGIIDAEFRTDKKLNAKASLIDFAVKMKNPLDSMKSDNRINLDTIISYNEKEINVEKTEVKTEKWNINLSGFIKNYDKKNPQLDLKTDIPFADIHALYWLSPSIDGDPQDSIQNFKKYGAWGNLSGKIKIKGSVKSPEVYGDAEISDVYIVKDNPIVPRCKIFIKFLKNKVKVTTRVFSAKNEYVDVDGIAEMKVNGAGDFHISSSKNVDLETVQYILIPIHKVVGFDLGPVPYMGLAGKGNIDILTTGSTIDGEVVGYFTFRDTTASLNGLNTKIEKAEGRLDFDKKKLHFYTKNAQIKKQPIKIDGKADLDGNIDFDVTSPSIETGDLLEILKTSPILADKKNIVEPLEKINGKSDVKIKIKGLVKDFEKMLNCDSLEISGSLLLKNNNITLKESSLVSKKMKLNASGNIQFKVQNTLAEFSTNLTSSFLNSMINLTAEYSSNSGDFDMRKLHAQGDIKPLHQQNQLSKKSQASQNLVVKSGHFKIKNGDAQIAGVRVKFFNSDILINAKVKNIFEKTPLYSYNLDMSNFDLKNLNLLKEMNFLPSHIKKVLNAYEDYEGKANITVNCTNNVLNGNIELKDVKFNHSYFKTPVSIDSGNIILSGEKIVLKSMIAKVDHTPIFINASVWDLNKTMHFSGYFTMKLTDSFTNKYINSYLTYPIKPKGDITLTSDINGTLENFTIKPKIKFAQNADIYYMGANLGDENDIREFNANIAITKNTYLIKKADYVRYMTSQNEKVYPLTILSANGIVQASDKNIYVRNMNLETVNNANVKMFNIIFKKSVLKNGMFNCHLNIKGDINNPKIVGNVQMSNLDMPLYDTNLKNISVKFREKLVEIKADGNAYDSDFSLNASLQNHFKPPYVIERVKLESNTINLDTMIDSLTKIPTPNTMMRPDESLTKIPFNISDLIIKDGSISAKDMIIRGLSASNYSSDFNLKDDMVLRFERLGFDVTSGKIIGTASFNFTDNRIKAELSSYNVDSNKVASSLFDFKDQIFGKANGSLVFTTKGSSETERLKNLSGVIYFDITDGKMPKLGSVEYLLKAGNFIKSGITGASLSNLLELIAPIKTGHFESIKGRLALKNGVAQDIEVYSKGDNLNLYINGEYDILNQYANMKIYGRLTKKTANILGTVGNVSLNSILNAIPGIKLDNDDKIKIIKDINKIPGVELSDQKYRVFTANVDGKINEEKYVKSFRWIE